MESRTIVGLLEGLSWSVICHGILKANAAFGIWIYIEYQISDNLPSNLKYKRLLVGSRIVDHSDVVGASPVGAAPTTSSFST